MAHPLVDQLRFTRSEFKRGIQGIKDEQARQRFLPMNCISWNIGHLAWQEQRYFLHFGQGFMLYPEINQDFAYGAPASTPPLKDMVSAWKAITAAADPWLDSLTTEMLLQHVVHNGKPTAPAHHLSLLVSPGRKPGHSPAAGSCRPATVRRQYRPASALPTAIDC